MTITEEISDSRQRVLDAAEQLFVEHGYKAITLRDIADELGIKQASLYYHFPGGKEQLFMAMAERLFQRHREGLTAALAGNRDLQGQLRGAAHWFGSQRPMNMLGMFHADIPALGPEQQGALYAVALESIYYPLRSAFVAAQERGEIRLMHPDMLAGSFLWLMDGLNYGQTRFGAPPRERMVDELVALLLDGLRPRADEPVARSENRR
jgi:AcrR family transcriptional regulator